MKTIFKNILSALILTSAIAITASETQQTVQTQAPATFKQGCNALIKEVASSETTRHALAATKGLIRTGAEIYAHSINPIRLIESPADRIMFVAGAWATCVGIQATIDTYNYLTKASSQGNFEWCFSLRKPSNAFKVLVAGVATTVGLNMLLSRYGAKQANA